MTLVISEFRADGRKLFDGDLSFGFERYRSDLWGTDAVRATGAVMIPRLDAGDLYVEHAELDTLEAEAELIIRRREEIASAVFDVSRPGTGQTVVDGQLHDAFGGSAPADSIQRYVSNLLRCIGIAKENQCGVVIW